MTVFTGIQYLIQSQAKLIKWLLNWCISQANSYHFSYAKIYLAVCTCMSTFTLATAWWYL